MLSGMPEPRHQYPQVPRRIVLLTGRREAAAFETFLLGRNPALNVQAAPTLRHLERAVEQEGSLRLIAFLTGVIVPRRILERLTLTPYNIHPGPPEYPGSHPESFAIWERARRYGVTIHEMAPRVDEGAIVWAQRFDMPKAAERLALADRTYGLAVEGFAFLAAHCAASDAPLPRTDERWRGAKTTNADFDRLRRSGGGLGPTELERLRRACGADFVEPQALRSA